MLPRILAFALTSWVVLAPAAALAQHAEAIEPYLRPALIVPRPTATVTLAVTQAGQRLVAVGERGIVVLSDDQGRTWRQVETPVSVTLTSVRFVNERRGWATGHSGVVLSTSDGGNTWARQLDGKSAAALTLAAAKALEERLGSSSPVARRALAVANQFVTDGPDKPLLDLHFADENQGFVVGAYGLALSTADGGKTWVSVLERLDNPKGLHLNAIGGNGQHIVIAGEQGLVLRSKDGGREFARVETPYRGSWFSVYLGRADEMVLAGLRGNAFFSPDAGSSWSKVDFGLPVSITTLSSGASGQVLAGNQAGGIFASRDGGRSFQSLGVQAIPPLASMAVPDAEGVVVVGLRGIQRVELKGVQK